MDWLFSRKGLLVWVPIFVVSLATVGLFAWRGEEAGVNRVAAFCGILGLPVSVLGFAFTIWQLRETQRIEREAQAKIEAAVERSRQETQRAVEKIGVLLLGQEAAEMMRFLHGLLHASAAARWQQALFNCDEARARAIQLAGNPHLVVAESVNVRKWENDLRSISQLIAIEKLQNPEADATLSKQKSTTLNKIIDGLGHIQARFRNQVLEVPRAD